MTKLDKETLEWSINYETERITMLEKEIERLNLELNRCKEIIENNKKEIKGLNKRIRIEQGSLE